MPCLDRFSELTHVLGSAPGEDDVSGTITVPEVAHDTEEDEYVVREAPFASVP